MTGIVSYGAYVPRYRLSRKTISAAMGWLSATSMPGEKAVANHDEDSVTMAVAAGMDCLTDADQRTVDALYFCTTSAPYRERESAAIIATALDFRPDIQTADFADSLKSGTGALLLSCHSAKAQARGTALVCAADCRLGRPGSPQEVAFGDGAAAFLVGNEKVIASLEGHYGLSYDFPDHWRAAYDKFDRTLEDRWAREEGYTKFIPEAISGLMTKVGLKSKDIAKVGFPCMNPRDHATVAKSLGLQPEQVQDPLLTAVGNVGAASPLMILAAALDDAKPGDNIVVASYGNGSEALLFKVTDEIATMRRDKVIGKCLASKRELDLYEKYLAFRGIVPYEVGFRGEVGPTQLQLAWRERGTILSLIGSKCKRCRTPQYPAQRICVKPDCGAVDEMEACAFSRTKCTLFSFTEDRLAYSVSPPQAYGMIDFDGGGRYVFDITDCDPGSLKVNMPMQMAFRRKYVDEVRGIHGYYWKAKPLQK